jgi:cytochrome b
MRQRGEIGEEARMQQERSSLEMRGTTGSVRAWDLPTRLFHWSLVTLIVLAYVSRHWGDAGLVWHKWNGYAILVLVVWRLLWGVVGSSTARFTSFFYGPVAAIRYGLDFVLSRPRHFLGHNPLGGSVVLVMLAFVGVLGTLGLFAYDDHDALTGGPLSSRASEEFVAFATKWHLLLFDVLLWVIALHILANILYLLWKRENLIKAMITGRKQVQTYEDEHEADIASPWLALGCLVVAAVIVLGGITAAGGKLM